MTQPQAPLISASSGPDEDAVRPSIWRQAFKEAAITFLSAALLLAAVYSLLFLRIHPEFARFAAQADQTALSFKGDEFVPVQVGDGAYQDGAAIVTKYLNGAAILELRKPFVAEKYPFLQFSIKGLTTWSEAVVFWQRKDEPGVIHKLPLNSSGDGVTQIAMVHPAYRGEIGVLALGLISDATGHDNDGAPVTLSNVELRPFSAQQVIRQLLQDWMNPPKWQGYANNIVIGVHPNGILFPNLVAHLLILTSILLYAIWRFSQVLKKQAIPSNFVAVATCLFIYGWILSDSQRWFWRADQILDSNTRYYGLDLNERIRNSHIRCNRHKDCFDYLLPYF